MKRIVQFGLASVMTVAAVAVAPFASFPAHADTLPIVEALELTEEQQSEIQAIVAERRADIDEVLTDAQQAQFREVYSEIQDVRAAFAEVDDLTQAQKEALVDILRASRADISNVLTDEQRSELRSLLQERRGGRRR